MTNTDRRQLARVRNAFLGATALAGIVAIATPASAVVIRDDITPTQAVDTTNVTGVGQMVVDEQNGFIGLCTATLINPRTVIFASHCVNENPAGNGFMPATGYGKANGGLPIGFFFNANNNQSGNSAIGQWLNGVGGGAKDLTRTGNNAYNSNFVVYDTSCCTFGLGGNFFLADVAMAGLDTPAVGIPTWTTLFSPLSSAVHATVEGYGDNGNGTTGQGSIDFRRRVAENIVSYLGSLADIDAAFGQPGDPQPFQPNLYMTDFNYEAYNASKTLVQNKFDFNIFNDIATAREGITAPGDSGGPLVVDHAFANPTIAAVLSGGITWFGPTQKGASYGTDSFYQPLYLYWDWIVANNPYKYVGAKAGNGQWTDPTHWVMNLDPNYVTIVNGKLVNALPTTAALGGANIPPGFGSVCYFGDCVNIVNGTETNPTPIPPNPTAGSDPAQFQFTSDVSVVPASTFSDPATAPDSAVGDPSTPNNPGTPTVTPDVNPATWTNPENSGTVGAQTIIGLPGTTLTAVPNDTDANATTGAPARYYDVTFAAAGTTTLSGASITIDRLTINGASAGLTIASGATLSTLIDTTMFAGTFEVDGTYNSVGDIALMGGVLTGTGTVNAPHTTAVLGSIAPGTPGTIGTLTLNGALVLSSGSGTLIDFNSTASDLLTVNGTASLGGTLVASPQSITKMTDTHIIMTATTITGAYNTVTDTIPGVLFPVATTVTAGAVQNEVLSFKAASFFTILGSGGTADQNSIATILDAARGAHYNDLSALYQAIDPLTDGALAQALENLTPDAARVGPAVDEMASAGFDEMLWQRLEGIGGSGGSGGQAGLHIDSDGIKAALNSATGSSAQSQQFMALGSSIATNPGGGNDAIPTTGTAAAAAPNTASGAWLDLPAGAGGFLSGSSLNGDVDVGGGGGRADVTGLIIAGGLDAPVGSNITLGGSMGYTDATTTLRSSPAMTQTEGLQGALYARLDFGKRMIAEAYLSYGGTTIQTRRVVVVGPTTFNLAGHTVGNSPSVGIYLGRSFDLSSASGFAAEIIPSVALSFDSTHISAYTETGGAPAMTFAAFNRAGSSSRIGFDADMTFDVGGARVSPNLHAFWINDFTSKDGSISAAFAAAPSSIATFSLAAKDSTYAQVGVGADVDLGAVMGSQATLSGRYDAVVGRDDASYGVWTGRLSIKF